MHRGVTPVHYKPTLSTSLFPRTLQSFSVCKILRDSWASCTTALLCPESCHHSIPVAASATPGLEAEPSPLLPAVQK